MKKLDEVLLKKYAQVMVNYALNNGKGINKGDTVFLVGQECTRDLFISIAREVYAAGGNLITNYQPDNIREKSLVRYLCLLYTSDAADERSSVDLGGRRI